MVKEEVVEVMVEKLLEMMVEEEVLEVVDGGKNERAALFLAFLRAFNETKGQIFLSSWLEV